MAASSNDPVRREMVRRVQVGGAGVLGVLIFVSLTGILVDSARKDAVQDSAQSIAVTGDDLANSAGVVQKKEPLAELGVAPSTDTATDGAAPAVPDLEPDPKLQRRMDRDPREVAP
jgi:hypothetical protein